MNRPWSLLYGQCFGRSTPSHGHIMWWHGGCRINLWSYLASFLFNADWSVSPETRILKCYLNYPIGQLSDFLLPLDPCQAPSILHENYYWMLNFFTFKNISHWAAVLMTSYYLEQLFWWRHVCWERQVGLLLGHNGQQSLSNWVCKVGRPFFVTQNLKIKNQYAPCQKPTLKSDTTPHHTPRACSNLFTM